MYAQINQDIELIRNLIQEANEVDLFENFDDDRDYKQELLDLTDDIEKAQHESSPSFIKNRMRREMESINTTIDSYMEAIAEDPESRDLDYPISAMGEVIYDITENNPSEREIRDELFGKFISSFYASGFCMAFKQDAKPAMSVA